MNNSILVIMAGGRSSRMERDKALLPFDDKNSLAEYQYERFKPLFSKVYISAKNNKFDFPVEIIEDCYPDSSPLVALVSIFEQLDVNEVMILSVDSPFVDIEVFRQLKDRGEIDSMAVVAESPRGVEPLCAIYQRSILPVAKTMIQENRHRLQRLLESVKTQKVFIDDSHKFMNLNYFFEYKLAKTLSSNI